MAELEAMHRYVFDKLIAEAQDPDLDRLLQDATQFVKALPVFLREHEVTLYHVYDATIGPLSKMQVKSAEYKAKLRSLADMLFKNKLGLAKIQACRPLPQVRSQNR
jgi:hypothetical protein